MPLPYPPARMGDVQDDFFGVTVSDPYRWLEDPNAPEVRAYAEAQHALARRFLDALPGREPFRRRMEALYQYPHVPSYGEASRAGDYYFYSYNPGADQAMLYRRKGADGAGEVVLDPNQLSADGSVIVMNVQPSPDGEKLAYGVSFGGSDWQEFRVRDLATGKDLPNDVLQWCKFTFPVWANDGSGFYYNRFVVVPAGEERTAGNTNCRVCFHRIGTAQAQDTVIFYDPETPGYLYWPQPSSDGEYLVLHVMRGSIGETASYVWKIGSDAPFTRLFADFSANFEYAANNGSTFYYVTKDDAPRKRLIALDLAHPEREHWREIIPTSADSLDAVRRVGDYLVAVYLHRARAQMRLYTLDGNFVREIPLPGLGSVPTFYLKGSAAYTDFLFTYTSFLSPMTTLRYDTAAHTLTEFQPPGFKPNAADYETVQVFYPSTDGTDVSMFITHKRGIALDGSHPTLVYAYGGFDASVTPDFEIANYVWLENGGVYAVPNLRGGGEYGEEWHQGGMKERKQQVFDDMIRAVEWLIAQGYTASDRVAIRGMSNGGLLVAACITQRPDLFGAALCGVPVIDMLRYHKFTSGRLWTGEYGCAEASETEFKTLIAYSPLHNVRPGTAYPPTLIWTSDGDDRVVPMHSLKFAAVMQAAQAGDNPILLRYETNVGHGTVNVNKTVEEESDYFAFLAWALKGVAYH